MFSKSNVISNIAVRNNDNSNNTHNSLCAHSFLRSQLRLILWRSNSYANIECQQH